MVGLSGKRFLEVMNSDNLSVESADGVIRVGKSRMVLLDIEAGFWGLRRQMEALVGPQLTDTALQQAGANAGASFAQGFKPEVDGKTAESAFRACLAAFQASGFGEFEVDIIEWPLGRLVVTGRNTFEAWMMQQHGHQAERPFCAYTAGVLVGFINSLTGRKDVICLQQACQAQGAKSCQFELLPASEAQGTSVVSFELDSGSAVPLRMPIRAQSLESDTRELSTLLDISQSVASTLEIDEMLGLILEQFQTIVQYDGASVMTLDQDTLQILAYRGPIPQNEALALRFPLKEAGANQLVIEKREPVIISDVRRETPLAQTFQATAGERLDYMFDYVRSWMGVPLITRDQVIGMISLDHSEPNVYTRRHSLLARTFADKVAVAIENARLYHEEHERRRELQTLLDVAATANSSLDLQEMLWTTLDRLVNLVGASRAGVILQDEKSGELAPFLLRPERAVPAESMAELLQASQVVMDSGEALYVAPDIKQGFIEPGAFLPLRIREQVVGLMGIIGAEGEVFSSGQLALFQSIADQVAVAMENARLYEQAEQSAALAERNRLARDLHDAVSQTLFSASLIAEVLPQLWEKNPAEGRRRLEELRELTRGALAEMRALLMELRPSTLTDFSLGDLLRQLAEAEIGRSRLGVDLSIANERSLPPEIKIAFYRIAQEALHNVGKHAGATCVNMLLQFESNFVELVIADDGRGFDVENIPPNSLGVGIMRERAAKIRGNFTITSQIGEGTKITVRKPLGENK
jgi:signal transduction histidine kinase/predicted hydrocarbon binding protein